MSNIEYFVKKNSIVREIWGNGDTILVIFAGAAAEFALNKAVDWLYFTGKLPADPLGRLFSTVSYARGIVFAEKQQAFRTIDAIASIHAAVEGKRGAKIPDWAYRDVLFMLVDYSIRSYEIMERKLTLAEKEEVFDVFFRLGTRMGLAGLPESFQQWEVMRSEHLRENMEQSKYTKDLFAQYQKHLGAIRFHILLETQILVVPQQVRQLLGFRKASFLSPLLGIYKLARAIKTDWILRALILPEKYIDEIKGLDRVKKRSCPFSKRVLEVS